MDQIEIGKVSYPIEVHIVGGVPQCLCCGEPMVQVEPEGWMCALGAAILAQLREVAIRLDEFVLG